MKKNIKNIIVIIAFFIFNLIILSPILIFVGIGKKSHFRSINSITDIAIHAPVENEIVKINKRLAKSKEDSLKRPEYTIAVIDTGIDYNHFEVRENLKYNFGEIGIDKNGNNKRNNGIDDDKNGYIDDYLGWNFAELNNEVMDTNGHGTHVSGIILTGVNKNHSVKLLPIKYFDENASGLQNLKNTLKAIEYAIKMKVDIINYSSGGPVFSYAEKVLLDKARQDGILVFSAAGNEGRNNDRRGYYPANYRLDNIVSVASVNRSGALMDTSNYGAHNVDVAALGENVSSALPKNKVGTMSGTSQATAIVTAAFLNFVQNKNKKRNIASLKKDFLESLYSNKKLARFVKGGKTL